MSTDLTFITNEPGNQLHDRFKTLLADSRHFDCLVGYFFISGFHQLHAALTHTEHIRILIGMKTDQPTMELLRTSQGQNELNFAADTRAATRHQMRTAIERELQQADESAAIEDGIRQFIAWIQSGKLVIRAYSAAHIHAKLYIMTFGENDRDVGRVITGSSNFTESGLKTQLEFNVELKNRGDYDFAQRSFNALWAKSVDVTADYITTIETQSPYAHFTPYELYLKLLCEYFRRELTLTADSADFYLPDGFKQLKYQAEAVLNAQKILEEYGGVFLADVVGLGKTYMAALLAQQLNEPCLIIAPPHLLDDSNPNAWSKVFGEFGVRSYHCESIGKLKLLLTQDLRRFKTVFIDESHRFRSQQTQSYDTLAQICRGKRVVLVSATPFNNSPQDILSQIKLFQYSKKSTIPNVPNLDAFFDRQRNAINGLDRQQDYAAYCHAVQDNARKTREQVLKYVMIRRTRREIETYYGDDLRQQGFRFPTVADPKPLLYQFNADEAWLFNETIRLLTQEFKYARYLPLVYYTGEQNKQAIQSQRNIVKFMKILMVKRLESSIAAFRATLDRFINTYEQVINEFQRGRVFISKRHSSKVFTLLEKDDQAGIERLLTSGKVEQYLARDFKTTFLTDLQHDHSLLTTIRGWWQQQFTRDPKWECCRALLTETQRLRDNKIIMFTESQETAQYLAEQIKKAVEPRVLLFTGATAGSQRQTVTANFDAKYHQPADDYRILIATDVLAEGINLHRANVVINYDIPWNPTRLIQRVGRVNRVDTPFDTIYTYNFFPTDEGNDQIKLREAAEAKIHAFIHMLGTDARLLTAGEEIVSHDLFSRLNAKQTLTGEDEAVASELAFLTEIRTVREQQPELFARIERMPRKARSTRGGVALPNNTPALLTYFRQGQLDKFFMSAGDDAAIEVDFIQAATLLKPIEQGEPRQSVPAQFYALFERNRAAFVNATTVDSEQINTSQSGNDHSQYLSNRLKDSAVRRCAQFTADDKAFIKQVRALSEQGALPTMTVKSVVTELKLAVNIAPLNVLKVLRRHIQPELLQPPTAAPSHIPAAREVVLSSYLLRESTTVHTYINEKH